MTGSSTVHELASTALRDLWEAVSFGTSGVHPGLAVVPIVVAVAVLAPLGWLTGRMLRGSGLLMAAAGVTLAIAVVAAIARPGLRSGTADASLLARCIVTEPFTQTFDTRLNLLLLVPFAALAALAIGRPLLVTAVAGVSSLSIETIQALYRVGACDSSDLVHNTLGALVAAVLAALLRAAVLAVLRLIRVFRPPPGGRGGPEGAASTDQVVANSSCRNQPGPGSLLKSGHLPRH